MKKESFFARNYKLSWKYLKEVRFYLLTVFCLLIIGALVGYFFPIFFQDFIRNYLKELVEKTQGYSALEMILFIFKNNFQSSLMVLILGIVAGIFPIISGLFNGYLIGFVIAKAAEVSGLSVALNLLPHGIFEIPAIILSMGMGIKMASFLFAKKKKIQFFYDLENSLRVFVLIVLPLLIIAALIEGILISL